MSRQTTLADRDQPRVNTSRLSHLESGAMLRDDVDQEVGTMRVRAVLLATALMLTPFRARAADLVVWWEEEFYPGENQAVRDLVAAFEQKTGKRVELAFHPLDALPGRTAAAVAAG